MSVPARSTHFANLNDTGQNITAGQALISKIGVTNSSAAAAFIQVFDAAAADVVLGTTVPVLTIPVAATAGFTSVNFVKGWFLTTRLSMFSTTTPTGSVGSAAG